MSHDKIIGLLMLFCVFVLPLIVAFLFWRMCRLLWRRGPRGRIAASAIAFSIFGLVTTCTVRDVARGSRIDRQKQSLEATLNQSFTVGDPRDKIERVLRENHVSFAYVEWASYPFYSSRILTEDPSLSIIIKVQLDDHQRYQHASVTTFWTFL